MEWFSLVNFPGLNLVLEKEAKPTFKNCKHPAWQNNKANQCFYLHQKKTVDLVHMINNCSRKTIIITNK